MPDTLARLKAALANRYAIERELGGGGMATVYLATDLKHHRPVALKVLNPELAAALGAERFLREIEVTARLTHPHILPLLDSGEADGLLFYVMPYVEGETLRARLEKEKQLPLEDALRIAAEVADALGYAHAHDVLHRDIKPENVLFEGGHAVVADFGLARAMSAAGRTQLTESGVALGTPRYMSPEQVAGERELDARSDLYSLGCVLYEMLAGEPPFTGPTAESVARQHLTADPPLVAALRAGVPEEVSQSLLKALAKTPADRFDSVARFREAITTRAAARKPMPWRTVAGGALVLAVLLSLVKATTALMHGGNSAGSDAHRVLVVAFTDEGGSPGSPLGRMAQDYIIQVLTDAGFANVVDPLTTLAVTQNVAATGLGSASSNLKALAADAGAGTVVSGSYYTEGDSVYIQARISDARNGRLLASIAAIGGPIGQRRELLGRLAKEVVATLAPLVDQELGTWEPRAAPASLEAYEAYSEGLGVYLRGDEPGSASYFERALKADPGFIRARFWAAQSYRLAWLYSGHRSDFAKAESLIAPLVESRGQLNRYERCRLDFVLALGPRPRPVAAAYDAARCMTQAAPGSDDAKRELALFAQRINRPIESRQLLRQLDPDHGLMKQWEDYWYFLAVSYHMLGDYKGELEVARQGLKRPPITSRGNLLIQSAEARALAALGRLDEVRARVSAMRSLGPEAWGSWSGDVASELRAHGYREAALDVLNESIAWYQSRPHDTEQFQADLGSLLYQAERWGDAERLYDELARAHPQNEVYLAYLGFLAARRGDRKAALRISERLRSPQDPLREIQYTEGALTYWRACIASLLGDREDAVALLSESIDQGTMYGPGLQNDMDLEPLHDFPPFQELLRPKG